MRKKVVTLKEAKPALRNLVRDMKRKYGGRNVVFERVTDIPDDELNSKLPSKVQQFLSSNPHIRQVGHDNGVEFYYYKAKMNDRGVYLLPLIIFVISRDGNMGNRDKRVLACSLNTYLPKISND